MNSSTKLRLSFAIMAASLGSTSVTFGQYYHARLTVTGTVTVASDATVQAAAVASELRMDIVGKSNGTLVATATIIVNDGESAASTAGALRAALTLVDKGIAGSGPELLALEKNDFDVRVCSGSSPCPSGLITNGTAVLGQTYVRVSNKLRRATRIKIANTATGSGSVTLEVRSSNGSVILSSGADGVVSGDSAETTAADFRALFKVSANLNLGITSAANGDIIVATAARHTIRGCLGAGTCPAPEASTMTGMSASGASTFPLTFFGQLYELEDVGELTFRPPPIPAVSQWGLLTLAMLVLAGGTVVLRRRSVSCMT